MSKDSFSNSLRYLLDNLDDFIGMAGGDMSRKIDEDGNEVIAAYGEELKISDIRRLIEEAEKSEKETRLVAVSLLPAESKDAELIHKMQKEAFLPLLLAYRDYDSNPGTETVEFIRGKIEEENSNFFLIVANDEVVGGIRVKIIKSSDKKKLGPLFILPGYQSKGYAQSAILEAEKIFGSTGWFLETPINEEIYSHLYKKMGYTMTDETRVVNESLTLVRYQK